MARARRKNVGEDGSDWVFGYGSLIYKVDFPVLERAVATLGGWTRRFWQGSHDHRGTPEAPGRVATLVPDPAATCLGVAYRIEPGVLEHLDHREKNGYRRHRVALSLADPPRSVDGLLYVAEAGNPAWLGPATADRMAAHIARSRGPSGSNGDYLLQLADALQSLGAADDHVFELAERVRELQDGPV
jgi:cation transport regulator ChaC